MGRNLRNRLICTVVWSVQAGFCCSRIHSLPLKSTPIKWCAWLSFPRSWWEDWCESKKQRDRQRELFGIHPGTAFTTLSVRSWNSLECSAFLPAFSLYKLFVADIPPDTASLHVFLLICGLRRVKDPLYLVEVFSGRYLLFEYPCFVPGFRCISFNASKFGISYFIHCRKLHRIFTFLKNAHVTIDLFNTLFLYCVFSSLLRITEH